MTPEAAAARAMAADDYAHALDRLRTWRAIAQQAIHRLAAREAEHEALRMRHLRLLDEYKALRASTRRAA